MSEKASVTDTNTMISTDLDRELSKGVGEVSPVITTDSRLLRKIDLRVTALLFACYFLQFLDKVVLNYSNLMGLATDLKLVGNDFSWLATAFFIGYAVAEIPQSWLLQRFPVAKILGVNILLWGIVICASAGAHNFATMCALRTLLGCFEAVISPALILTTAAFYTKREAGPRYGFWYCGLGCGQILGGIISYGAQHGARGAHTFGGWRIMMVAVGSFNIVVAILVLIFLPDSLESARFLNQEEKESIREKLALDQAGTGQKVFKVAALAEVFTDLQVWLLVLLTILIVIPSGVITTFSATLIRGFGYNPKQAALLNMPSGIVSIASTMLCTWAILKGFPRWLSIVLLLIPVMIGAALMSFTGKGHLPAKLAGIYLINTIVAPLALIYTWTGANCASYTKKVVANGLVAAAFSIANIIGPQTFQAKDAKGGYIPAKITIFGVAGGAMVVSILLRLLYGQRNKTRAANRRAQLTESPESLLDSQVDLTDKQNPAFIYCY